MPTQLMCTAGRIMSQIHRCVLLHFPLCLSTTGSPKEQSCQESAYLRESLICQMRANANTHTHTHRDAHTHTRQTWFIKRALWIRVCLHLVQASNCQHSENGPKECNEEENWLAGIILQFLQCGYLRANLQLFVQN